MKDLIKKLVESFGPTGFEDEVRAIIHAEIKDLVDEIRVGKLGDLIAIEDVSTHLPVSPCAGLVPPAWAGPVHLRVE